MNEFLVVVRRKVEGVHIWLFSPWRNNSNNNSPFRKRSTNRLPTWLNTCSCVLEGPKIQSNVKDFWLWLFSVMATLLSLTFKTSDSSIDENRGNDLSRLVKGRIRSAIGMRKERECVWVSARFSHQCCRVSINVFFFDTVRAPPYQLGWNPLDLVA